MSKPELTPDGATHERAEKMVEDSLGFRVNIATETVTTGDGGFTFGYMARTPELSPRVVKMLWSEAVRLQAELLEKESGH